mmetsp:Transcript_32430/g.79638  ORF Transcript_32430/g.79638 Transcript_32430/m.79638 type:complete len:125 (+) Transcript_32430:1396-1770(+)
MDDVLMILSSQGEWGKRRVFSFRNIRCDGADWRHLFFVGRLRNPRKWESNADVEHLVWVGYVGRDAYEEALVASGRQKDRPMLACVSPGELCGRARCLGKAERPECGMVAEARAGSCAQLTVLC